MARLERILIQTASYDHFVNRARSTAQLADQGAAIQNNGVLSFSSAGELLAALTPRRCQLLTATLNKAKSLSELHAELGGSRQFLKQEVTALVNLGLLLQEQDGPPDKRPRFRAAAERFEIHAVLAG